jgi:predicted CoA-binding protein
MNDLRLIRDLLGRRRVAFVGVSTHETEFSHYVFRALASRGYDVVPVHPRAQSIDGRPAHARVQDIPGGVDWALVMTPPEASAAVVSDCAVASVRRVWLHRGAGRGALSDDAVSVARAAGMELVAGECPMMFLPGVETFHRAHAGMRRMLGHYPQPPPRLAGAGRRAALLVGHALAAWASCAAAMLLLRRVLPPGAALGVHAAIAPLLFGVVAVDYFRHFGHVAPLAVGAVFAAVAAVLDAGVVAGAIERSPALLASGVGFWLPLALGFAATAIVGAVVPPLDSRPALVATHQPA